MSHLDKSKLSEERNAFLQKNLGELQFVFAGNKTTVLITSIEEQSPEFGEYKVTTSTQDSVEIRTDRGVEAKYYFVGDCMYLVNDDWQYREYFCRAE